MLKTQEKSTILVVIKCVLYASSTILAARERGRGGGLVPPTRNFVAKRGMGTWRDAVLIDGGTRLANTSNHRNEAGARKKKTHLRSLAVDSWCRLVPAGRLPGRRGAEPANGEPHSAAPSQEAAKRPKASRRQQRSAEAAASIRVVGGARAPCPCVGGGWLCGAAAAVWSCVGFRVSISLDPGFLEWALAQ